MTEQGFKWLYMTQMDGIAANGFALLENLGNGWKWLEMCEDYCPLSKTA